MTNKKVLSYLGLAKKAGRAAIGSEQARAAIRDGSAALVLMASDASANAVKRAEDACAYYKRRLVPVDFTAAELGAAAGKAPAVLVAFCDEGFAEAVEKLL